MNTQCPDEQKLIAEIRAGKLADEMRTHLKICAHCREIAEITEQLKVLSESLPAPQLSGASGLYRKAKLVGGDQFYRVLLPIWIVQLFLAVATIIAAFAGMFSGREVFSRLAQWFHYLPGLADLTGMSAFVVNIVTIASFVIIILLPLTVLGMWFRDILNEKPASRPRRSEL
ncbi:MAG: hypothetical protein DRJ08_03935 [Acidobacteria bacterium]|nr:MAG: hypothetical protein DRJ14_09920 [Acidobacteriota bacterium]RLE22590.1 MAG: hypothetical protein DRJ08_03935 [Acidobacteriota bacterium]